ncbi:hypothetical protein Drorol1_Dr00019484, partial [Drosera rotundifolia]
RRWTISCFKKDEFLPEKNLKPEVIEQVYSEEHVKPKIDSSNVVEKDRFSVIKK